MTAIAPATTTAASKKACDVKWGEYKAKTGQHGWKPGRRRRRGPGSSPRLTTVLYVLLMVIVIVGLDLVFFRDLFWERLLSNVGVVLVFAAFGLKFLR